jgi:ribonuclease BN (tRNA processing enzyme)
VRRGGDRILFDCGEGTQRQLLRSSIGLVELPEVFVTHYHADHYLGLPGMLKTFALRGRETPITQMMGKEPTANSKGIRLINMPQVRDIQNEEFEKMLNGEQTAQQALDNAVARSNAAIQDAIAPGSLIPSCRIWPDLSSL